MKYSKIFIALTYLLASSSFALDILNASEESALQAIQQEFDVDNKLISANNKLSSYNKNKYDYTSLAKLIEDEEEKYKILLDGLSEKVLSGKGVDHYFKKIENSILSIDHSKAELAASAISLKEQYQIIEMDYGKLGDLRIQKNKQLSVLKRQIVARLVNEFSKPNSAQQFNLKGSAVCSKFQSINNCLDENEKLIVSRTKKSAAFLNDNSLLLSYKVNDASMNMDGVLNYNVSMAFKPSYNNRIEVLLNERFGMKSTVITLESNVDADWYIDGNKVGTGKKIKHKVTFGRHGILASYKSHDQSSIEIIQADGKLTYVFEDNVVPLLPGENSKMTSKSEPEIKQDDTKQSDETSKVTIKGDEFSSVTDDKDYLFFVGLDPKLGLQQSAFYK